jgi:hypothetical protein
MLIGELPVTKNRDICPQTYWDYDVMSTKPISHRKVPAKGRMWNIQTSQSMLDFADHSFWQFWQFSTHNGYVSTNWTHMLIQLAYDPDLSNTWEDHK